HEIFEVERHVRQAPARGRTKGKLERLALVAGQADAHGGADLALGVYRVLAVDLLEARCEPGGEIAPGGHGPVEHARSPVYAVGRVGPGLEGRAGGLAHDELGVDAAVGRGEPGVEGEVAAAGLEPGHKFVRPVAGSR